MTIYNSNVNAIGQTVVYLYQYLREAKSDRNEKDFVI